MPTPVTPAKVIDAVRKTAGNRVKVACLGYRRDPARKIHAQGQVRVRPSKAVSASAMSCSAGIRRTSATTTRSSPAGTRAYPDALARIDLGTHRQRAVGRQRAVLPGRVRVAEGRQGSAAFRCARGRC